MRRFFLLLSLVFSLCLAAQPEQVFLLDFGPNDGTNGNATASPDANGNWWTNVTNPATNATLSSLTNQAGDAVDYTLTVVQPFSTNGINHGGLLAPDANLLDSLAVATATQDYFFNNTSGNGLLRLAGLDPAKQYVFQFFASRNNAEVRQSRYELTGANVVEGTLQSSGPGLGGNGYNGNTGSLYTSPPVTPRAGGSIDVGLGVAAGSFAYINLLVIQEFSGDGLVAVDAITVSGEDITENGATRQMTADVSPADATFRGVRWSVDDPGVAFIRPDGELVPLGNGTVTVTATTTEPGSTVSGSATVTISGQETENFFLDLGPAATATTATDDFGNRWNNLTEPGAGASVALVNDGAQSSDLLVTVTDNFGSAGPTANDLATPLPDRLGQLAVASATSDYFTSSNSSELTFSGLDPDNAYRFQLFGSAAATGRRNTTYSMSGFTGDDCEVQTSGTGLGGPAGTANDSVVCRSELVFPDSEGNIRLLVAVSLGRTAYLNALRLTAYADLDICPDVNERGIAVMGSSVARGQGAPNDRGYAFQYGRLLEQRFADGAGRDWDLTNISVGGNNTVSLLNRWTTDLVPLCDRYVVYGLSLANEGIRNRGQAAFDDFRDNMRELIRLARAREMVPVVVGNYSRRDFDAGDYAFIKEMNLLIHQWDVPSVNVLGANDNGSGNWVAGYEADLGHPNLAGHTEFFHAFVPSLFDALDAGKPLPVYTDAAFVSVGSDVDANPIVLLPEETVHPFTVTLSFRTTGAGDLLRFATEAGADAGAVLIDDTDRLSYVSPGGAFISGSPLVADGNWHTVSLTHYHARGETLLYVDGQRMNGSVSERLVPTSFAAAGATAPPSVDLRNWFFHRSGMNADELAVLHGGAMLKSSLELYAPLDGQATLGTDPLVNFAQSTNQLLNDLLDGTTDFAELAGARFYPNPVTDVLRVELADGSVPDSIEVRDGYGRLLRAVRSAGSVRMGDLPAGAYWVRVLVGGRWSRGIGVVR